MKHSLNYLALFSCLAACKTSPPSAGIKHQELDAKVPELCVAWPPFANDAGHYDPICLVGNSGTAENIRVRCHAHIGREVFPQDGGGPEMHCIEASPSRYIPPRVFGATFEWADLCPNIAERTQSSSPQHSASSASIEGMITLQTEAANCCSGPLTGKTNPEEFDCMQDGNNCVTFMLSGSASPIEFMLANANDPLRQAICQRFHEEGGATGAEDENSATHRGMKYFGKARCLDTDRGRLSVHDLDHDACFD